MMQWDFQNKRILTSPARLSFVLEVPLRHLGPSVIYSVPCDRILQRAYYNLLLKYAPVLFIKCLIAGLHADRSNATFFKIL